MQIRITCQKFFGTFRNYKFKENSNEHKHMHHFPLRLNYYKTKMDSCRFF